MRGTKFAAALLAAVGVLAWSDSSRGDETIRLNGVDNAPARNLVDNGRGADTVRTWHHGFGWGGYGGWGYRGLGWGWGGLGYRGLGWGYGGLGYRGLGWGYGGLGYGGLGWGYGGLGYGGLGWGGFYRPFYGLGLYRPFYGFGLGYGLGYGGFGYGIGYGGLFGPCAGAGASVYTLNVPPVTVGSPLPGSAQPPSNIAPPRPLPSDDGTYPYDGGPQQAAPSPTDTPSSAPAPRSVPRDGRSVSLPRAKPKWSYPAYGEIARRSPAAPERTYLTRSESKKPNSR